MKDWSELRRLAAVAAEDGPWEPSFGMTDSETEFATAATPFAIIGMIAENDQLRAEVERLRKDKDRLDAIEGNCWDVRYNSSPNGDAGDSSISIEIVGHFMAEPCERVVGENYHENLRAAIDQARTAEAYPPARPEYDDEDTIDIAMEANQ